MSCLLFFSCAGMEENNSELKSSPATQIESSKNKETNKSNLTKEEKKSFPDKKEGADNASRKNSTLQNEKTSTQFNAKAESNSNKTGGFQQNILNTHAQAILWQSEYQKIMQSAKDIAKNFSQLKIKTEEFLQHKNWGQDKERMSIAIIGSGAFYLSGDLDKASIIGREAFEYGKKEGIKFPQEWDTANWIERYPKETVIALAKMKDFIISSYNKGHLSFIEGNKAFIGNYEYEKGLLKYQEALSLGLENNEFRRDCYFRLAVCLIKAGRTEEAKKIFVNAFLVFSDIKMDVADSATQNFLNKVAQEIAFKN